MLGGEQIRAVTTVLDRCDIVSGGELVMWGCFQVFIIHNSTFIIAFQKVPG